jgi:3,4-dihydroxy 2-butanone 4-phosphate synthase/GTP cyclohydrolase II
LAAGGREIDRDGSVMQSIEEAISALANGQIIVVVDDADRENEGDLVMAAQFASPEAIAFFLAHTSGFICVAMEGERLDQLELPLMVADNTESQRTAFTITVDYRHGTTTGISAADRAATIRALASADTRPSDLARPGHILPLRAARGGVLKRAGHTEASVDLCRLAGLAPAGVICEVVTADKGGMARGEELAALCEEHGLVMVSIADLIRYRHRTERLVVRGQSARLPTDSGEFTCVAYESLLDGEQHLALVKGDIDKLTDTNPVVRVHSECLTGDVFSSRRCDCGTQLRSALEIIDQEGSGVVVYLRGHEGRGIGLGHKIRAYNLQDQGLDTVDANLELGLPVDSREYGIGAQILCDLGVTTMRLITNNPAKYGGLAGYGLTITERVALPPFATEDNRRYLETKRQRLGHLIGDIDGV